MWIDTDDIVGSERWRASVAEAITRADIVLLVVSPASMQSENVEREITVAAEHDLRILPVVVERRRCRPPGPRADPPPTSLVRTPLGIGTARLTLPDGTDLGSDSLWGVIYVLNPGQTIRDVRACFTVPAPVAGEHRFTITYDGAETFPEPLTITL